MMDPVLLDDNLTSSLSAVLEKTHEELTDQDVEVLIAAIRRDREEFLANEAAGKPVKKSKIASKAEAKAILAKLSFEDLMKGV